MSRAAPNPPLGSTIAEQPDGSRTYHYRISGGDGIVLVPDGDGGLVITFPGQPPAPTPPPTEQRVPFSFASPGTTVLGAVTAGSLVVQAEFVIDRPFNGTTPNVSLGTSADPSGVLSLSPIQSGTFESGPVYEVTAADVLLLSITGGGSSQGTGTLLYQVIP